MNLTPEQILEKIMGRPTGTPGIADTSEINPEALASYLASIQPKEGCECAVCIEARIIRNKVLDPTPKEEEKVFMECDNCRSKPGAPYLCKGCLHNRTLIDKLEPSLLSIPRPKGWRVGQTLDNFITWLRLSKHMNEIFYSDDSVLDRYYQEFLASLK
jgi:hypothetical protein